MASVEPIRLRQRTLKNGNVSLYLDIYRNGKREYEYLKLYLIPEKTKMDKETNRKTMLLAEAIKAKRIVELQNGEFGFKGSFHEETKFFDFYKSMCEERRGRMDGGKSKGNWGNWYSCLLHLENYEKNKNITFKDITPKWVQGFKTYLDNACAWEKKYKQKVTNQKLSQNSKQSYFNKLRACLNQAFEQHIIVDNPMRGIEGYKGIESTRLYLTLDEVKKLAVTPCSVPAIKDAFLFSCLTGLRRSDILSLTWDEVHEQDGMTRIIFKQVKTGGIEYLDISPQAVKYMRHVDDTLVFPYIHTCGSTNNILKVWAANAGIEKDITFHCGRHTFATLMLTLGTDLYTVSKLLGHRDILTTQIYAKVIDKNKQAAVKNIPDIPDE
jgi:integrase